MEQAAVNRKVVGSNPISGAKKHTQKSVLYFFIFSTYPQNIDPKIRSTKEKFADFVETVWTDCRRKERCFLKKIWGYFVDYLCL